jgi:hypothetical protein
MTGYVCEDVDPAVIVVACGAPRTYMSRFRGSMAILWLHIRPGPPVELVSLLSKDQRPAAGEYFQKSASIRLYEN